MNDNSIRDRLVDRGRILLRGDRPPERLTNNDAAHHLLNDLDHHPHAFVLASIMDRGIKSERAWLIPFLIREKLGSFTMDTLLSQTEADIRRLMSHPNLHRYVDMMAKFFFQAVQRIARDYKSDAALIWKGRPSSGTVIYRFLQFNGIGPKIATMNANILVRRFKVEFSDYSSIDISVDVHVRRVFGRLGLTPVDASVDQLVFRARGLHPEFPGLMDLPAWEIGRNWCRPNRPVCNGCYMADVCPSSRP